MSELKSTNRTSTDWPSRARGSDAGASSDIKAASTFVFKWGPTKSVRSATVPDCSTSSVTVHALAKQPTSLGSFLSRQKPKWKHLLPPPALLRTGPARRVGNLTLRSRSAGVWCALCAPLLVCLVCQQCFRSCHVDLRLQLRGEAVTDGVWSLQVPHRSEQLTRGVKEGWSHNARPSQHYVLSVRQLNGRGSVGRPHFLT